MSDDLDTFKGKVKLRHLVVALAVADHGSAVAAAGALFISQPAVTRTIHELERILGVSLFDRTAHGMTPTAYAEPFLQHARAVLSHLRQATEHIRELTDAERGTVTVGLHLAGGSLLQRAVVDLKRAKPMVNVKVLEGPPDRLRKQLAAGAIDLVVSRLSSFTRPAPGEGERLSHERLFDEEIQVVCGRGSKWLGEHPRAVGELVDEPWVLPLPGMSLRRELEDAFLESCGRLPQNTVETTSLGTVQRLASDAGFLAVLPEQALETLPLLEVLPVSGFHISSDVGVVWAKDHIASPVSELLLAYLRDQARRSIDDEPDQDGQESLLPIS